MAFNLINFSVVLVKLEHYGLRYKTTKLYVSNSPHTDYLGGPIILDNYHFRTQFYDPTIPLIICHYTSVHADINSDAVDLLLTDRIVTQNAK